PSIKSTIQSEEGEVIDCVDIYKQPAFDHPLTNDLQYAQISQKAGIYHGAKATINVWNPKIEAGAGGEYSISHVSVLSMDIRASPPGLNFVEAGWIVSPGMFNDTRTRFFAYWTTDNSLTTGCFNLNCPGFVQTTQKFAMGSAIEPLSIYDGPSYNIAMAIYKPMGGTYVTWGGEIINSRSAEHHTATQMGSGHFPGEGYRKASYFGKLKVIDDTETEKEPDDLEVVVSNSRCYDVHIQDNKTVSYGLVFFYGGPGYSPDCP
ncbi:uncharacterized protein LOC127790962, partial [Diospyros lotus]|uniref:uncharacterized protein LOC127790962 n=1 Tax=Diospyros lotus TaxID=55363 RepID=UPI00225638FC